MPASSFTRFEKLSEDFMGGVHNLNSGQDGVSIALVSAASGVSVSADAVLADIVQVSYTNMSTRLLAGTDISRAGAVTTLLATDHSLAMSGGDSPGFRYLVFYNSTVAGGPLIGYYDYGSDVVILDGDSLLVDMTSGPYQLTG